MFTAYVHNNNTQWQAPDAPPMLRARDHGARFEHAWLVTLALTLYETLIAGDMDLGMAGPSCILVAKDCTMAGPSCVLVANGM